MVLLNIDLKVYIYPFLDRIFMMYYHHILQVFFSFRLVLSGPRLVDQPSLEESRLQTYTVLRLSTCNKPPR